MASNQRPGGLTALAVINFVWGGISLLLSLAALALLPLLGMVVEQASQQEMNPQQQAQIAALADIGGPLYITIVGIGALAAALLIASGVGYLKLKKFLGRTLGNTYAAISIASGVVSAMTFPPEIGGGFGIGAIIGLIYPVLTLFLLNVTFKDDFVN